MSEACTPQENKCNIIALFILGALFVIMLHVWVFSNAYDIKNNQDSIEQLEQRVVELEKETTNE